MPAIAKLYYLYFGAGNETRTRDPDLGKVVLYQLSYSRNTAKNEKSSSLWGAHYTRNLCYRKPYTTKKCCFCLTADKNSDMQFLSARL